MGRILNTPGPIQHCSFRILEMAPIQKMSSQVFKVCRLSPGANNMKHHSTTPTDSVKIVERPQAAPIIAIYKQPNEAKEKFEQTNLFENIQILSTNARKTKSEPYPRISAKYLQSKIRVAITTDDL